MPTETPARAAATARLKNLADLSEAMVHVTAVGGGGAENPAEKKPADQGREGGERADVAHHQRRAHRVVLAQLGNRGAEQTEQWHDDNARNQPQKNSIEET